MLQEVDGGPVPRSLAGCGGPSCEEDEAGGTTAAEMVEGATREGRGRLILRGFLRAPSQLRGATWAEIGQTLENAAAAAGWKFDIVEYPNGGTSYRLKSPSPTGGSIIWERAGRDKGGDILKGDWYWRISPGNNRPVVRIK